MSTFAECIEEKLYLLTPGKQLHQVKLKRHHMYAVSWRSTWGLTCGHKYRYTYTYSLCVLLCISKIIKNTKENVHKCIKKNQLLFLT